MDQKYQVISVKLVSNISKSSTSSSLVSNISKSSAREREGGGKEGTKDKTKIFGK